MKDYQSASAGSRPLPLSLILATAAAIHMPPLLMMLPLKSYDTNFHIFFASHYLHHWFDPWNPKWFAGFSQATYPPLTHQWIAMMSHIVGLRFGYMTVQFAAILLLVIGVYRFSLLWVDARAASFAALASVFLGSESFLVYSAGQIATTSAAPIYLNALPYFYAWIRRGKWQSFVKATALFAAAAAAHHATLLFGSFLFALPVLTLAFFDREDGERVPIQAFLIRTFTITVVVGAAIAAVLLPYWIALIHYPITQTPIPHASRSNFILSPEWGVQYFLVPYGALLLAIPFVFIRGSKVARLRPLLFGFWLTFLIGLGGTTQVASILLRRAFEVLTFERFTYWATLLAVPFVGLLASELVARYRKTAIVGLSIAATFTCALGIAWTIIRPADPQSLDVQPVASWLNSNGHDKYRYLTLGFGNRLSELGALTDADSVDGEWNSGRMLPELTKYGGGPLTQARYFGTAGLVSVRAILKHADRYGLKWVFVRDSFFDPLMSFAGWREIGSLDRGVVGVWEKDGVPPATPLNVPQIPPRWQGIMWGILPFGSSILAVLVLFIPEEKREEISETYPSPVDEDLVHGRMVS